MLRNAVGNPPISLESGSRQTAASTKQAQTLGLHGVDAGGQVTVRIRLVRNRPGLKSAKLRRLRLGDRQLVADQLAATVGEDRRAFDQACPLLLAPAGGESSDAAAIWWHAAEDRGAAVTGWIADGWVADKMAPGRARQGPVCEESVPKSGGVGLRGGRRARTRLTCGCRGRPRSSAGPRLDAEFGKGY